LYFLKSNIESDQIVLLIVSSAKFKMILTEMEKDRVWSFTARALHANFGLNPSNEELRSHAKRLSHLKEARTFPLQRLLNDEITCHGLSPYEVASTTPKADRHRLLYQVMVLQTWKVAVLTEQIRRYGKSSYDRVIKSLLM
jgi:hypothetical protein